jgi:protein O-GlcNAc transferase
VILWHESNLARLQRLLAKEAVPATLRGTMPTVAEVFALAWQNHQAGNFAQAEMLYRQVLQADPNLTDAWGYLGMACQALGKLADAEASFRRAVQYQPGNASARNCLAAVLVQRGMLGEASAILGEALRVAPDNAETHNNLGSVLARLGRTEEAIGHYRHALRVSPDFAQAHYNLGLALKTQGQLDEAARAFGEALRCQSDFTQARHDLGDVLIAQQKPSEAESQYRQALRLEPNRAETHNNLGSALQSQGRLDEAMASYLMATRLRPNFAAAHYNLGTALQSLDRLVEAAASYRQALRLNPNFAEGYSNLGLVHHKLGNLDEAVVCHQRAVKLKPRSAECHVNLAGALREKGQLLEVIACYRAAHEQDPGNAAILGELVHMMQHAALWGGLGDMAERVIQAVDQGSARTDAQTVSPFTFLALPKATTPGQQHQCARLWSEHRVQSAVAKMQPPIFGGPRRSREKIAIGYLSADFHEHATAYLIAELIEKHDRGRFAIFGYSYGPDDGSPMRRRLLKAFDRFVDLKDSSFLAAASRIHADEVDILVDLKGYTRHARTEIMALRPAPIQVNYLGYPGTMAAPFIDYILVDDFVVPAAQQPFFTEKLVHLPGCYQVNDSQRPIAAHTPSRAQCGLPETGFVFVCFNNTYKISTEVFDVWMRLLRDVPGSVLWLLAENSCASANLRREARDRGVAPDRLVFAVRLGLAEHLARHRQGDLFLDTVFYDAHTTASDALWAGCPVLTIAGEPFPSRVAGSLLRTLGLPELITTSLDQYAEMALRLAQDADLLGSLRARLEANRGTSGLFDGGRFARSLEVAYCTMWDDFAAANPAS